MGRRRYLPSGRSECLGDPRKRCLVGNLLATGTLPGASGWKTIAFPALPGGEYRRALQDSSLTWRWIIFLLHPTHDHASQNTPWIPLGGPQLLQQAVAYVPLAGLGVDRGGALALALVAHLQVEERGRSHFTSNFFFLCLNQTTWDNTKVVDWWRGGENEKGKPTIVNNREQNNSGWQWKPCDVSKRLLQKCNPMTTPPTMKRTLPNALYAKKA